MGDTGICEEPLRAPCYRPSTVRSIVARLRDETIVWSQLCPVLSFLICKTRRQSSTSVREVIKLRYEHAREEDPIDAAVSCCSLTNPIRPFSS